MVALNDSVLAPVLALGDEVAQAGVDIVAESSYGNDDLSIAKAMLGCTIVDGLTGILALLRSYGQAHADTIARSMFEAVGDLFHLCAAEDNGRAYLHRMEMSSALISQENAEHMICRRLGDEDSALVLEVAKDMAREAKETIAKLTDLGVAKERLSIRTRVNAPALSNELLGVYAEVCFDAHHDITALRKRHFRGNKLVVGDTLNAMSAYKSLSLGTMIAVASASRFNLFARAVSIRYPALLRQMDNASVTILNQWTTLTEQAMAERGWQSDGSRK